MTAPWAKKTKAKKRKHGEGTVCFEAYCGKWQAAVTFYDDAGKRKRKKRRFSTQREAIDALAAMQRECGPRKPQPEETGRQAGKEVFEVQSFASELKTLTRERES